MLHPSLGQRWSSLTAPHPSITDIERRRQSRLLANFAVVTMGFQLITGALGAGGYLNANDVRIAPMSFLLGLIVYLLNRAGYYGIAAYIIIGVSFALVHSPLIAQSEANFFYVASVLLASAILLSSFTTAMLFLLSVVLQLIFVITAPKTFEMQSFQPLIFTIMISSIILVFIYHRLGLEGERRTELHQTISALRKSEARWRSLVENVPEYIIELDSNYRIRYTNRVQGSMSPEMIVGKLILEFMPPDDVEQVKSTLAAAIQLQKNASYDGLSYSPEGVAGWYSTTISPIIREGQLDGIILVSRDVSEHKEAEQQRLELSIAQERVQLLSELIADLSHDLKTPLSIINNSLFLLDRLDDPQKQRDKLAQIKQQALRLEKIIQDILTLSALDKAPQLNLIPLNLNQLAGEVEKQLLPVANSKGVKLKSKLHQGLASVQGDEEALRRALANLIENALNYTAASGEVTVQTEESNQSVTIEIRDTGIGIASEDLPHIFDRFYRATEARKTLTSGTGLGLAIVKKTVEMHQGNIDVTSQLGIGTTFRISLPLSP